MRKKKKKKYKKKPGLSWAEKKSRIAANFTIDDILENIERPLYDEEPVKKFRVGSISPRLTLQHKLYKWYGYEDNINISNLYFPKNYYADRKLYSIGDGSIYLRYIGVRETFRSALATFIPYPYSLKYNDNIYVIGVQNDSFNFNIYHPSSDYDNGNEVLECRTKEGFIIIGTFIFVDVFKQEYWLLIELDNNRILLVCISYSSETVLGSIHIYVVDISDTGNYDALE